jgi:signal peptidase II
MTEHISPALLMTRRRTHRLIYLLVAAAVFVADRATKWWVVRSIPEHNVVPVIPGFFNLIHVKNEGAAFGLFADSPAPWKTALLVLVSVTLLATVIGIVWKGRQLHWEAGIGLALILGGALSNLVDRIRDGRVVDFLDVYLKSYHWYTFNVADSAIVAGAILLILQVVFSD